MLPTNFFNNLSGEREPGCFHIVFLKIDQAYPLCDIFTCRIQNHNFDQHSTFPCPSISIWVVLVRTFVFERCVSWIALTIFNIVTFRQDDGDGVGIMISVPDECAEWDVEFRGKFGKYGFDFNFVCRGGKTIMWVSHSCHIYIDRRCLKSQMLAFL